MASRTQSNGRSFELELQLEQEVENKPPTVEKDAEDSIESSPNREMTTYSQHYFGSIRDGFSISIIENMKEEYGLFVWPSSVILAEYVWQQKSRFSGVNVVELGAGTSLPGLVAAKVGADVTLTDDLSKAEVLSNMRRVCNINDLKCKICPDSVFITTYHNRSGHHLIEFLMEKWRLKCTKLLDGFSFLPPHKASKLSGDIQLAEIVLDELSSRSQRHQQAP